MDHSEKTSNICRKQAKDMKRHFAKDNVQVANKHMEMCYTS